MEQNDSGQYSLVTTAKKEEPREGMNAPPEAARTEKKKPFLPKKVRCCLRILGVIYTADLALSCIIVFPKMYVERKKRLDWYEAAVTEYAQARDLRWENERFVAEGTMNELKSDPKAKDFIEAAAMPGTKIHDAAISRYEIEETGTRDGMLVYTVTMSRKYWEEKNPNTPPKEPDTSLKALEKELPAAYMVHCWFIDASFIVMIALLYDAGVKRSQLTFVTC